MNYDDVAAWLNTYSQAWETYDSEMIGQLFSEDAVYRYHPWDTDPVQGREAIVANWLENRDAPGTYRGNYTPLLIEGQRAIATGTSQYFGPDGTTLVRAYHNLWVLTFNDAGACSDFTEWYMQTPASALKSP